jgi:hypothetical protein
MNLGPSQGFQNRDITIAYVDFNTLTDGIHLGRNNGVLVEHCRISNIGNFGGSDHPNNVYNHLEGSQGPFNITFRYNVFDNAQNTGIYISNDGYASGVNSGFYIYGNVFLNMPESWARAITLKPQQVSLQGVYILNNTFVNCSSPYTWSYNQGEPSPTGLSANNIYSSSGVPGFMFSGNDGNHYVNSTTSIFVNAGAGNYRLNAPVGTGANLSSISTGYNTFNKDPDGKTRGADGLWDIGAYEYGPGGGSTNAMISISPNSLDFGSIELGTDKNLTLTVKNVGGSTLTGTATVSPPFAIVAGGTYNLASNLSQTVTIRYSPTTAGVSSGQALFTGGGDTTVSLSGSAWVVSPGLSFESYSGAISSPFVVTGTYISQSSETGLADGGRAVYGFTVPTAGAYSIGINLNAPDEGANSLFVNIGAEPSDPYMIWDVPVTSGFENRTASWRGSGTFDSPEFPIKVFNLSAGTHQLVVIGREANLQLGRITISPASATIPVKPGPLRVVSNP